MNPREISESLQKELREQTKRLRPVHLACPELKDKLDEAIDNYQFMSELHLENITFYEQGATLAELSEEGSICQETAHLFAAAFGLPGVPEKVSLYKHQVDAIREARNDKNVIICTGTGSGKTESFLIPVIDWIIRERKNTPQESYKPGVRAMVLYPMNALVNDQIRRLRDIFKAAEKIPQRISGFDYNAVSSVTFGHYTGELKEASETIKVSIPESVKNPQERSKIRSAKIAELCNVVRNADSAEFVEYPYLSSEDRLKTEYADRSAWNKNSADIFITNYSMLERLLLDPQKASVIFNSETWRYIVLDEAHSYDGSLGTDIALLMRRVTERCGGRDKNIRFIATSATLVGDDESDKVGCIQNKFAAKLFPAKPDTFAVMMGSPRTEFWPCGCVEESNYAQLCHTSSEAARNAIIGILDAGLQKYHGLLAEVRPNDECNQLLDLTRWLKDWQRWSSRWQNAEKLLKTRSVPVGELVYITNLIAEVDEDFTISIEENASIEVCRQLWNTVPSDKRKEYITGKTGETSLSAIEEIESSLNEFSRNGVEHNLPCRLVSTCFVIVSELLTALKNSTTEDADLPTMAQLRVDLSEDAYQDIRGMVQAISDVAGDERIADSLLKTWNVALGQTCDTIESGITAYILERPHLKRLYSALSKNKGHELQRKLQAECFVNAKSSEEEFDAFLELITLSQHPELRRKPLMDLRYHQMVSGISEMAICFKRTEDGSYVANFLPDDASVVRYEGEQESPLYTMGICYACAQPYILAYRFHEDGVKNMWRLSRYEQSGSQTGKLCAFSWVKGKHEIEDEEDSDVLWFFNPDKSLLCKSNTAPDPGFIQVYYFAETKDREKQLSQCMACKEVQGKNGIISHYRTGSDRARTTILGALIKKVDPESICSKSSIANGRKLLAFSDSRSGAAKLAVNFDSYIESRIIQGYILDAMSEQPDENKLVEKTYAESFELSKKLKQLIKFKPILEEYPELESQLIGDSELRDVKPKIEHILWSYLPSLEKNLISAQAKRLLDKEYNYSHNEEDWVGSFSKPASLTLTALGELREAKRTNLVRNRYIRVYSRAHREDIERNDKSWADICSCFIDDKEAERFFEMMYEYFFRKAKIQAKTYDKLNGSVYPDETNESLDGYHSESKKHLVFEGTIKNNIRFYVKRNGKFVQELQGKLKPGKAEKDTLQAIWDYLKEKEIICNERANDYALNLDDVRFCRGEKDYSIEERQYYRLEEHTAQLDSSQGKYHQNLFAEGKINILSCSTTFEMGVDLGNLNCVFLNNMPPAVANYKQRAGRAGRRPGSVSYVLTYTGHYGHDSHYKEHPEEMFFGEVSMPHIDPRNSGALAKHLRAEALNSFLKWCKDEQKVTSWKKSGAFFIGKKVQYVPALNKQEEAHWEEQELSSCPNGFIAFMKDWWRYEQDRGGDGLQVRCQSIAHDSGTLGYNVADDLIFQIKRDWKSIMNAKARAFADEEFCLNLAGPHIERVDGEMPGGLFVSPAECRYMEQYEFISKDDNGVSSAKVQMLEEQTTDVLTHYQILPSYGFPCDVISLLPNSADTNKAVDMSRDIRTGLFEYAPGQTVIANKRVYESEKPLYYMQQGAEAGYISAGAANERLYLCDTCKRYYVGGSEICPMCNTRDGQLVENVKTPDAFRAKVSKKAKGFNVSIPSKVERVYTGGIRDEQIVAGTNMQIANSKYRTILYINKPNKGKDKEDVTYVHRVRTDIVLWRINDESALPAWPVERMDLAWQSALQALLKSTAKVMQLSKRDVDGEVTLIDGKRHLVLFDNASGGAGTILSLLPSKHSTKASTMAKAILEEAISLCKCVSCGYREDSDSMALYMLRTPVPHTEYLTSPKGKREFCSCYHCLKAYENQRIHATLDVHDAAIILQTMLNGRIASGTCSSEKGESIADGSDFPQTPSTHEDKLKKLEMIKRERERKTLVNDILNNIISLDAKLIANENGREISVRIVDFADSDTQTIQVEKESGEKINIELKNIIRKG